MNSTSSVACINASRDIDGRRGDWNAVMREEVVASKRARSRGVVRGADVVDTSVCTNTRPSKIIKIYGLG